MCKNAHTADNRCGIIIQSKNLSTTRGITRRGESSRVIPPVFPPHPDPTSSLFLYCTILPEFNIIFFWCGIKVVRKYFVPPFFISVCHLPYFWPISTDIFLYVLTKAQNFNRISAKSSRYSFFASIPIFLTILHKDKFISVQHFFEVLAPQKNQEMSIRKKKHIFNFC